MLSSGRPRIFVGYRLADRHEKGLPRGGVATLAELGGPKPKADRGNRTVRRALEDRHGGTSGQGRSRTTNRECKTGLTMKRLNARLLMPTTGNRTSFDETIKAKSWDLAPISPSPSSFVKHGRGRSFNPPCFAYISKRLAEEIAT
ncbi:uncharacterized protein LOC113464346 [Ceratina calcarata]|uniref:Uncharacterized protein LOC113464346 n=1 Tax=Ceratina calcarata TaxID=156304 RepID=A0AAJ7S251_9HYME|nr:uncharacterized protein LOC113464346 [Ceratina calcarata]